MVKFKDTKVKAQKDDNHAQTRSSSSPAKRLVNMLLGVQVKFHLPSAKDNVPSLLILGFTFSYHVSELSNFRTDAQFSKTHK